MVSIRGATIHKIHGSVRFDTLVSRFDIFSIQKKCSCLFNLSFIKIINIYFNSKVQFLNLMLLKQQRDKIINLSDGEIPHLWKREFITEKWLFPK